MPDAKPVIVCADDFAQNLAISDGILKLVEADRLSAVSCFADSPLWPVAGPRLMSARATLLVGLHFNLTYPFGYGEKPLSHWLLRSIAGSVDTDALRGALERQLELFCTVARRPPDFIDGHEHVHAFPQIRNVISELVLERAELAKTRIRDVAHPIGSTDAPLKRHVIRTMARLGSEPEACRAFNTGFGGDYSLTAGAPYETLFAGWLADAPPGTLIMCHPRGPRRRATPTAQDFEYEFLASSRFLDALERHCTTLVRGPDELPGRSAPEIAVQPT
jgi:predicted glycoside hydrolase/deacetylase ChbG (UPF0249 family)